MSRLGAYGFVLACLVCSGVACSDSMIADGGACLAPPDYEGYSPGEAFCPSGSEGQTWCSQGQTQSCVPADHVLWGGLEMTTVASDCCEVSHPDIEMTVKSAEVFYPSGRLPGEFAAEVSFENLGNRAGDVTCALIRTGVTESNLECDGGLLVSAVDRLPDVYAVDSGDFLATTIEAPVTWVDGADYLLFTLECRAAGEPFPAVTTCFRAVCRDGELVDEGCDTANNYQFLDRQTPTASL